VDFGTDVMRAATTLRGLGGLLRARGLAVAIHHQFGVPGLQRGPGPLLGFSASIESWFQLPEQGMKEWEILSRGSVFITPQLRLTAPAQYAVISAAHVSHPNLYRRFYPGPEHAWLEAVRSNAIRFQLTVREAVTGVALKTMPLQCDGVHRDLDLSLFSLQDEHQHVDELFESFGVLPVELAGGDPFPEGTPVVLVGHDLVTEEQLIPIWLNGTLMADCEQHMVVQTLGDLSPMGLCGGPALLQRGSESAVAAGMVFARVQPPHALEGNTLLVSAHSIREFMMLEQRKN